MTMINAIQAIRVGLPAPVNAPQLAGNATGASFKDCLSDSMRRLGATPPQSTNVTGTAPTERQTQLQEAVRGAQRCELARGLIERVEARVVAAYDEIKQIRV
jgi:flagellar hook-basal body complex protein FliE